jgi:hypothetical protein
LQVTRATKKAAGSKEPTDAFFAAFLLACMTWTEDLGAPSQEFAAQLRDHVQAFTKAVPVNVQLDQRIRVELVALLADSRFEQVSLLD